MIIEKQELIDHINEIESSVNQHELPEEFVRGKEAIKSMIKYFKPQK